MKLAFFISSAGDTELAKETIKILAIQHPGIVMHILPLTQTALDSALKLDNLPPRASVSVSSKFIRKVTNPSQSITHAELSDIQTFIETHQITRAYIGVPSSVDKTAYQIGCYLNIPCTFAYEYMFEEKQHPFWEWINPITETNRCDFAVPLQAAELAIKNINAAANTTVIGHISIDRAQMSASPNTAATKAALQINPDQNLTFVSGTSKTDDTDHRFLSALIEVLNSGNYPHIQNIQIRFGIHPGVDNKTDYLKKLLSTCNNHPQVKIILPENIKSQLTDTTLLNDPCLITANINGDAAADAAERVAQAVPGALLNKAALLGKPSYFHEKTVNPYLPNDCFANSIPSFFASTPKERRSYADLGLTDSASNQLAKRMMQT